MPERRLSFKPGIDSELTPTANRGGWSAADKIRYRSGYLEKLRGWQHVTTQPMLGVARSIHFWSDLIGQQWISAGTNTNLYVENQGTLYDITPPSFVPGPVSSGGTLFTLQEWSTDNFGQIGIMVPSGQGIYAWTPPTLPITPVNPMPLPVLITAPASLTGGFLSPTLAPFQAVTDGAFDITINGVVVAVTGVNFSAVASLNDIVAAVQAAMGAAVVVSSTVSSTGDWQISVATVDTTTNANITYASSPAVGTDISGLLAWTATTASSLVAEGGGAPPHNQGALVTMPQQILMAFGSSPDGGAEDPLLIRWSDQSNYYSWEPTTTNQAGSFRLPRGVRIVGAIQAGIATFIWTEYELWTAQYEGFPFVFGFFQQGASCGLIGQNAMCALGAVIYWMSDHGFFLTTGTGFQQIPCPVWDYVYLNLDTENQDKCLAATDYHYREVFFFFPSKSGGTGEIDSYVKYNVMENVWDTGTLVRTAWTDLNPGQPIGVDGTGIMQQHDMGLDADGQPMTGVSATSAYIDMADGTDLVLATRFIPDFLTEGANPTFNINLLVRSFPGDTPVVMGPFEITPETDYVSIGQLLPFPVLGVRGREIALQITCDALDTWFRIGTPRITIAPSGRL